MRPSEGSSAVNWTGLVPLVVGAPLVAAVVFMAAVSLGGATGIGPFKTDPPRNVAEALVLSDAGTAVWMLRTGADAAAIYDVRLEMLSSGIDEHIRPLVAAAYSGDEVIVGVALREGATLPPDEAHALACWLTSRSREGVAGLVAPPGWNPEMCRPAGKDGKR